MPRSCNKQLRGISAYDRTLVQLFITTLVLIPYCILHGDFVGLQITGGQLALLLILGVVHTGFAYSLYSAPWPISRRRRSRS